jgi:hypothetical protein
MRSEIMPIPTKATAKPQVIGQLVLKLTSLSEEYLQLVVEFVDCLEENYPAQPAQPLSTQEEARRRARLLRDVPREQLVARFIQIGEQIRQEAVARGTAVEGDWTGD